MRTQRLFILVLMVVAVFVLFGCASWKQSKCDREWGNSYRMAKTIQIINADAGKNLAPVTGLDGRIVESTIQKYYRAGGAKSTGDMTGSSVTTTITK